MDDEVTRIPLRNKHGEVVAYALIDATDEALVRTNGPWHFANGYAKHAYRVGPRSENRTRIVLMHRLVLDLDFGDRQQVDHINRDRLDNRRSNLRLATPSVNAQNASKRPGCTSQYRGVTWVPKLGKWTAYAYRMGKRFHLGCFDNESEAGRAARDFRLANMPGAVD